MCLRQVFYMRRNSLSIKVQVLNRLFIKNCVTRTEIILVSFLMCYFSYQLWNAASEDCSLTTLFSTKMRGKDTQSQEQWHSCPIQSELRHSLHPSVKTIKNLRDIFTLTEGFVSFS